eukprot:COSAG05_NODE_1539_length_4606_cov_2.485245_1_plen_219_part_00
MEDLPPALPTARIYGMRAPAAARHDRLRRRQGRRDGSSEQPEMIDCPVRDDFNRSLTVRALSPVVGERPTQSSSTGAGGRVVRGSSPVRRQAAARRLMSPSAAGHEWEWWVDPGCGGRATPNPRGQQEYRLSPPRESQVHLTAQLSRALGASSPGRAPSPAKWSWRQEAGWQGPVEIRRAALSESMFLAARQRLKWPEPRPRGISRMANGDTVEFAMH